MLLVFCSVLYVTTNWLRYTNRYAQRFAVRYTLQPTECSKLTVMKFCRPSGQFCFLNEFILSPTIVYICCWWYTTVLPNLCSECISHGKCICLALTIPYSPWDFHDSTFMHHGQLPQCVLWELSTKSNSLQSQWETILFQFPLKFTGNVMYCRQPEAGNFVDCLPTTWIFLYRYGFNERPILA